MRFLSPLLHVRAVLGPERNKQCEQHLATTLHGDAIAEMNDSHLFLVLWLGEIKLMHHFLSVLYCFDFKIVLWFLQQFDRTEI